MKVRLSILAAFVTILSFGCCQAQSTNVLNMKNETIFPQIFPQGDRLPEEFSRYFTGQAYLASISNNEALGTHISNVTFEPGCRNNWHSHTGGQLLLVTAGRGYYQERESLPVSCGRVTWSRFRPMSSTGTEQLRTVGFRTSRSSAIPLPM